MEQPKIIAIDMDGTLLTEHMTVSPENVAALQKAVAHGIQIYLTSGRAPFGMEFAAKAAGLITPLISYNGAFVYDPLQAQTHYSQPMSKEAALRALEVIHRADMYVGYYVGLGWYAERDSKEMRAEARALHQNPTLVPSLDQDHLPAPHKMIVIDFDDRQRLDDVYEALKAGLPDQNVHYSASFAIEIFDQKVSKGEALRQILRQQGLSHKDLMAIGDNYNDLSMMEVAGLSVAMGNAPQEVQDQADWVVANNDQHGVAEAIEKLLAQV